MSHDNFCYNIGIIFVISNVKQESRLTGTVYAQQEFSHLKKSIMTRFILPSHTLLILPRPPFARH
jgi:hypothetical protein